MTPKWLCHLVRVFFQRCGFQDGIELDPCSSTTAARRVRAKSKFTADVDGLSRDWVAGTVFMNPPFSSIAEWMNKLESSVRQNHVQLGLALLPSSRINCAWYLDLIEKHAHAILTDHVAFDSADGETQSRPADFASVFVLLVSPQLANEREQCWKILADVFKAKARVIPPISFIPTETE